MSALFWWTGLLVWAFWTLGALLLVALWVVGKMKARGAGACSTPSSFGAGKRANLPAPAPFRATGTHSPTHYADVDALLQEVRK